MPTSDSTSNRSNMFDLESAIMDANLMAELTADWVARALKAETAEPPTPDPDDLRLLHFAVGHVRHLVKKVDRAFYGRKERHGAT